MGGVEGRSGRADGRVVRREVRLWSCGVAGREIMRMRIRVGTGEGGGLARRGRDV